MDTNTLATRINQYLQLRAKRKALKEAFLAQEKGYREMESLLSGLILRYLDTIGAQNIKTPDGTCYRSEKTTVSIADKMAFGDYIRQTGDLGMLDLKANSTSVVSYTKAHKELPPGVHLSTIVTLGVRSPTKKAPQETEHGGTTAIPTGAA